MFSGKVGRLYEIGSESPQCITITTCTVPALPCRCCRHIVYSVLYSTQAVLNNIHTVVLCGDQQSRILQSRRLSWAQLTCTAATARLSGGGGERAHARTHPANALLLTAAQPARPPASPRPARQPASHLSQHLARPLSPPWPLAPLSSGPWLPLPPLCPHHPLDLCGHHSTTEKQSSSSLHRWPLLT